MHVVFGVTLHEDLWEYLLFSSYSRSSLVLAAVITSFNILNQSIKTQINICVGQSWPEESYEWFWDDL